MANQLRFEEVRVQMDAAMGASGAVIVVFATKGQAVYFRQRCYKFRAAMKEQAARENKPWELEYGRTPYEALTIDIVDETKVRIRRAPPPQVYIENEDGTRQVLAWGPYDSPREATIPAADDSPLDFIPNGKLDLG